MDAINSCRILALDCSHYSVTDNHIKIKAPISSLHCSEFLRPNSGPGCKSFTLPRLRISYQRNLGRCLTVPRISCLLEDTSEEYPKTEQFSSSKDSKQEAAVDLKLPRRSLLVTFTCDACGVRSQRLINRLAYDRGLVYVQCSGCSQYHKLVDNLGLVIEYNLQEGIDLDATTDEV